MGGRLYRSEYYGKADTWDDRTNEMEGGRMQCVCCPSGRLVHAPAGSSARLTLGNRTQLFCWHMQMHWTRRIKIRRSSVSFLQSTAPLLCWSMSVRAAGMHHAPDV